MGQRELGLLIVLAGSAVALVGLLVATGALGWFGRLPGDLRFGDGSVRVYAPLASMLIASVVLTLVLGLLRRLL